MMFKLNTLYPLDRIRGHAPPDTLPTPRPGADWLHAAACLGGCCCPLVQKTALPYGNILLYPLLCERVLVHRVCRPQAARLRACCAQVTQLYALIDTSLNDCTISPNSEMVVTKP